MSQAIELASADSVINAQSTCVSEVCLNSLGLVHNVYYYRCISVPILHLYLSYKASSECVRE